MGDVPPPSGSEDFLNHEAHQPSHANQHAFASQLDMTTPPHSHGNPRQNAFNMAAMVNNLPQVGHGAFRPSSGYAPYGQQQRFSQHGSSPPMMPHSAGHYQTQHTMHAGNHPHYYMAQHPQGQQFYGGPLSPTQAQARPGMGYYTNQMMMGTQPPNHSMTPGYYYQPPAPGHGGYQGVPQPMMAGQYYGHNIMMGDSKGLPQSPTVDEVAGQYLPASQDTPDNNSRIVRGPPRKPRQSGHAIWIGNLPPQTDLMSLVHHACKEAPGLESLFLISKSNCAFANFKDEATCIAAQQCLHDSKFQSVRLVSRLRKSTVEGATGVTAPTGPAASVDMPAAQEQQSEAEVVQPTPQDETIEALQNDTRPSSEGDGTALRDKFFILKSLTVEDLELSVRTGIWATQSHNEEVLNNAFKAADNVYLVFSANKSGEYFGYARMVSPINEDPDAAIQFAPKVQTANDVDLPKAIPTEATEFAPKGRIIDDSARGTIFWEVERDDSESGDEEESDASSGRFADGDYGATKAWGKPFKLEWLSSTRLPFYRTRGLRNPWNSNREVKIARDGTELESSVGRRLIGLFNRVQSPVAGSVPIDMRSAMMMPGYAAMRPY